MTKWKLLFVWTHPTKGDLFKLYQHVKERHRKGLFCSGDAKEYKKFPTQPGWIELGTILGKWERFWEWGLLFEHFQQPYGHCNPLLKLGLCLIENTLKTGRRIDFSAEISYVGATFLLQKERWIFLIFWVFLGKDKRQGLVSWSVLNTLPPKKKTK